MIEFALNGKKIRTDEDPAMPLLWFLRDDRKLTGTKYGCGMGLCGSCTVLLDGAATRSCMTPLSVLPGRKVTTIEGVSGKVAKEVQKAWLDLNVVQCGYCQSGQILSATALLTENKNPSEDEIHEGMSGNICRCATYHRIREAIRAVAKRIA